MKWLGWHPRIVLATSFWLCLVWLCEARASEQVFQYGPDPAQMLPVCAPDEGGAAHPAVLMLHGGGWQSGSREGQARPCEEFAARGIVAVPTDYRLNSDPPRISWPMQFSDAQLAMRWLRANAARWGVDPGHICAEGDSAGGQLALLLGAVQTIDPGDMQKELPNVSPHANCVAAISGPAPIVRLCGRSPIGG